MVGDTMIVMAEAPFRSARIGGESTGAGVLFGGSYYLYVIILPVGNTVNSQFWAQQNRPLREPVRITCLPVWWILPRC